MNRSLGLERLAVALIPLLVLWGIWSFGIWDPWELTAAEAARGNLDPTESKGAPLSIWLVRASFNVFGVHEWSGRLPLAICGLISCWMVYLLLSRSMGRKAGVIAAVVLATCPMFLLHARETMGATVGFMTQTWVALTAFSLFARDARLPQPTAFALLLVGIAASTLASGVLLGPMPPLLAVGVWALIAPGGRAGTSTLGGWMALALSAVLGIGVIRAVVRDAPSLSLWLGGMPLGGDPPTFEAAAEVIFHGFAPWSAALLVAVFWVAAPRNGRSERTQHLGWFLLLWLLFGYITWTVFVSRYGPTALISVAPLAGLVGIWITEAVEERSPNWSIAIVVVLFTALLLRDYTLYPESAVRALALDGLEFPDTYRPRGQWAAVLSIMAVLFALMLTSTQGASPPRAGRVVEGIRRVANQGLAQRTWWAIAWALLAGCVVFGLLCFFVELPLPSVVLRWGRGAVAIPFAIAGLLFGLPWLSYGFGRLGNNRDLPVLFGGLLVGAFVTLSFQPALSQHFSPRDVYDTYRALSEGGTEPLATYRLPSSAAQYYTTAEVEELKQEAPTVRYLQEPGQHWLVVPTDRLPALNRAFRRVADRHLFVADARSERLLLVASRPVEDRENENFIASNVLTEAPTVEHALGANFGNRIELVGYNLELPETDYVGAGQKFAITWIWQTTGRAPGSYKVFVHIDGHGQRLNGDHVPVGGKYAVSNWETGDVIIDRQELRVPSNYPVGSYKIYVGLFSGSKRLKIKDGDDDGDDRLLAGTLTVR